MTTIHWTQCQWKIDMIRDNFSNAISIWDGVLKNNIVTLARSNGLYQPVSAVNPFILNTIVLINTVFCDTFGES